MTPAIKLLEKSKISFQIHSYDHDPDAPSYGLEAAQSLNLDPGRVFKTLLVAPAGASPNELAVAIVPVSCSLDLKAMATALKVKKVEMASPAVAQRVTGYLLGGISPLGQKKRLKTVIEATALHWNTVFCSGGRRGLEIELAPSDLARLCQATFGSVARVD